MIRGMDREEHERARDVIDSLEGLKAAGIVESYEYDSITGEGITSWTAAYFRLLLSGRDVMREASFVRLWLAGDPGRVRAWIEAEAAKLDESPETERPERGAEG